MEKQGGSRLDELRKHDEMELINWNKGENVIAATKA